MSVLNDKSVQAALRRAWYDSQRATTSAHEEGGFVLQAPDGQFAVERWPRGLTNQISVPPHPAGLRGTLRILATFHTHPNTGSDFQQEPSLTDIRAVRDDPDLKHAEFEGEYVIAVEYIYRVQSSGEVEIVGVTKDILELV